MPNFESEVWKPSQPVRHVRARTQIFVRTITLNQVWDYVITSVGKFAEEKTYVFNETSGMVILAPTLC